ncbi:MAG TPA: thiamine phosphate synthase [Candidatus Acidoferrales bacterium]
MKPILCYVTDRKALGAADPVRSLLGKIRRAQTSGVDWVQLREQDMPARELLTLASAAVGGPATEARVLVNDRLDVALAAGAAGVHLGRASVPAREAVRWLRKTNPPAGFRIGVSCHRREEACEAEDAGASYVYFGPVFDTPSKRSYGPPLGTQRLAQVCGAVRIPVIAIGGVNEQNAAECVRAGAAGIAAIRMFQELRDGESLEQTLTRLHGER